MTAPPPDDPFPGGRDDAERAGAPATAVDTVIVDPPAPDDRLRRSASLSPTDRVIPSWTDPTVRRASDAIGGPMGRHAVVGRAKLLTPLRVCLLMAIVILICGWLFKAACIQQGPDGAGGVDAGPGWATAVDRRLLQRRGPAVR